MWTVLVLFFLAAGSCSAQSGTLEKLSHSIIRNYSTYHSFYPSLEDETVFTDVSDDLINWVCDGVILKKNTSWSSGAPIRDLDINVIGPEKVRLYYTASVSGSVYYAIGVASAQSLSVTGNFTTRPQALVSDDAYDLKAPSLVTLNNGTLLLTFGYGIVSMGSFKAVLLNDDGTDLASDVVEIIKADQDWEAGEIQNQWGFQRGDFVYIFYETGAGAVGVARSSQILGPYEKMLLTREKKFNRVYLHDELKWGNDGWPIYHASTNKST